jgi:hypothetical protein
MRKIKEILRLHHELGLSRREIGRSVSVSPNTVADVIRRAQAAFLGRFPRTWAKPPSTPASTHRQRPPRSGDPSPIPKRCTGSSSAKG